MAQLDSQHKRDSLIATIVTILVALCLFIFLYWGEYGFSRADMAAASTPEIAQEEELFLEPEILETRQDVGEPESESNTEASPEALGEPEPVEPVEPIRIPEVKGPAPEKTPPTEKLVTQTKESPVSATTPSGKETKKVSDPTAGAFSPHNGSSTGKSGQAGAGGSGNGVTGNANGWTFKGCPIPSVRLTNKVSVKVTVTVDEKGNVTSAKASGSTPQINALCEQAAYKAKWQPNDPANRRKASGTITFTIFPS